VTAHLFAPHYLHESTKTAVDGLALGVGLGSLIDKLPSIAALFTIVWTIIRIVETRTAQAFIRRRWRK
jgi:F0F1-type ATP synthase assembly protein I